METRVWLNRSQPQTLYNSTMLLYLNAAFGLLFGGLGVFALPVSAGCVGAGYGIANEKSWGYKLGVAMAFAPAAVRYLAFGFGGIIPHVLTLLFEVLLIVLLLHPESREYQRIWFK